MKHLHIHRLRKGGAILQRGGSGRYVVQHVNNMMGGGLTREPIAPIMSYVRQVERGGAVRQMNNLTLNDGNSYKPLQWRK